MSTVSIGRCAEEAAAAYLREQCFKILEQNYRRPHCEIDLVASKDEVIYFVEVKYRSSDHFGGGLDYIANQKLRHMQRAAETWIVAHGWNGEYQLSAVEVGGPNFRITGFIEDVFM